MRKIGNRTQRIERIERWLRTQTAPILRWFHLEVDDGGEGHTRVVSWERDASWDPARVAKEADDALTDLADDSGQRVRGRIVCLTETEALWTSFTVQADPEGQQTSFEASSKGVLTQTMKHHEALALQYLRATQANVDSLIQTNESLQRVIDQRLELIARLEAEVARLRDDNAQLKAELMEAQILTEQAVDGHEAAVAEVEESRKNQTDDGQMLKLVGQVVQAQFAPKPSTGQ